MQSSFVIDAATKESLRNKTLIFDTNALLDAYHLPIAFYDLAKEFDALNCDRVTTRTIVVEFLGGTTAEQAIADKRIF